MKKYSYTSIASLRRQLQKRNDQAKKRITHINQMNDFYFDESLQQKSTKELLHLIRCDCLYLKRQHLENESKTV